MFSQKMAEGTADLLIGGSVGRGSGDNDDVIAMRHFLLGQPVAFPDESGDPASDDALSYLFAYGNTESVDISSVFNHIHYKMAVGQGLAPVINMPELKIFSQGFGKFHISTSFQGRKLAYYKRPLSAAYYICIC